MVEPLQMQRLSTQMCCWWNWDFENPQEATLRMAPGRTQAEGDRDVEMICMYRIGTRQLALAVSGLPSHLRVRVRDSETGESVVAIESAADINMHADIACTLRIHSSFHACGNWLLSM